MLKRFYSEQWQQFQAAETTYATSDYTWPEWHHQGRQQFCFWGLLPNSFELERSIQQAQQQLAAYLLADYQKQTHITLYAAGFLVPEKRLADDVTWRELQQQADLIQQLQLPKLKLQIGASNSFLGAPFLEVVETAGQLQRLHQALSVAFGQDRDGALIPHVTLGLYRQAWATSDLTASLTNAQQQGIAVNEQQLHLLSYSSDDIRSPLSIVKTIQLGQ